MLDRIGEGRWIHAQFKIQELTIREYYRFEDNRVYGRGRLVISSTIKMTSAPGRIQTLPARL